jgi:hypothetical protein
MSRSRFTTSPFSRAKPHIREPLGFDACLMITHMQLVRKQTMNPTTQLVNARAYQQTFKYLLDAQFGRELEEDEVLRINLIMKRVQPGTSLLPVKNGFIPSGAILPATGQSWMTTGSCFLTYTRSLFPAVSPLALRTAPHGRRTNMDSIPGNGKHISGHRRSGPSAGRENQLLTSGSAIMWEISS